MTEKNTNLIDTYDVDLDTGLASGPNPQASAGATPFGFAFDRRGHLIVSEAFGGAADASAVSSYAVADGIIDPISPSVATSETAACWIVVTKNGRFAYTTQHRQRLDLRLPGEPRRRAHPARRRRRDRAHRGQARSIWR